MTMTTSDITCKIIGGCARNKHLASYNFVFIQKLVEEFKLSPKNAVTIPQSVLDITAGQVQVRIFSMLQILTQPKQPFTSFT